MLAVVLAGSADAAASVVAARTWRDNGGSRVEVLAAHPDLVAPLRRAHGPETRVRSWADLGVEAGATGAALAALAAAEDPGERVVVLPATSLVLAAPAELADGPGVVVALRAATVPPDDGRRPNGDDVAARGATHDRLFAFTAGDDRAASFLRWRDEATAVARASGAAAVPGVSIVADPGIGLAWWNVHERPLTTDVGGAPLAGGHPLQIVDFDGWRLRHGHVLHPEMDRPLGSRDAHLRRLVDRYADLRREAGDRDDAEPLVTWPADPVLATVLETLPLATRTRALRDDGDARDRVAEHAAEPDPEACVWGLSRYLLALHRARPDLAAAFPDLDDRADARALLDWARGDGAALVPERYRAPIAWLDDPPARPDGGADDGGADDGGPTVDGPAAELSERARRRLAGVNVIGFLDEPALGVAEIARQVADGLERAGVPVERVAVDRRGLPRPADGDEPLPHRVSITCVNADLLPVVRHRLRRRVREDGMSIGLWWWELEQVPATWEPAIALVHEVWAGSSFVAEAFRRSTALRVRETPLGLSSLPAAGALPGEVAGDDRPYVLVVFDYASQIERKNPIGAIDAFLRAGFGERVRLVLKSVGGRRHPIDAERVRLAAEAAGPQVVLLDRVLPEGEQAALVAGAAAFLSPHRAEGLGLTVAEAMLRGVPVIATDYGGSTDLLDARTGWPIAWAPGTVPTECGPYPAGERWAEPDLGAAASALEAVLAGGPAVAARTEAARASARDRADRLRRGEDLAAAAEAAISWLDAYERAEWEAAQPPAAPSPPPTRIGRLRATLKRRGD